MRTRRSPFVALCMVSAGVVYFAMSFTDDLQHAKRQGLRAGACTLTVRVVGSAAERLTGLAGRDRLPDAGLLLQWEEADLHAVWMHGMRMPLDLAWLDRSGIVLAIASRVPPCLDEPCRILAPPAVGASVAVLETDAGRLAACDVQVGHRVEFLPAPTDRGAATTAPSPTGTTVESGQ